MLRCQRDDLFAQIHKERIAADEKRANAILHHCHERGFDVACVSGSQDNELQPDGSVPLPAAPQAVALILDCSDL